MGRVLVAVSAAVALVLTGCTDPAAEELSAGNEDWKKGDFEKAAEHYGKSLQLKPDQKDASKIVERQAMAYIKAKKYEEGEKVFISTIASQGQEAIADAHRKLAAGYLKTGPLERAELHFNKALEINPKDDTSLAWIAEIYSQLGGARKGDQAAVPQHLEKAISLYDQAIGINPDNLFAHVNRRIAIAKLANYEVSQKEVYEKAALAVKKDKVRYKEEQQKILDHQAKIDGLRAQYELEGTLIREIQAKQKAAADAGVPG